MALKRRLKRALLPRKHSIPINTLGLNPEDRRRIQEIGFAAWWTEACDAQEARLRKRAKTSVNRRTT